MQMRSEKFKYLAKAALRAARVRPSSIGINLFDEIQSRLPNLKMQTLFDVGANEGQTADVLVARYPGASIHCFEPNLDCCKILSKRFRQRILVHQIAIGSKTGQIGFDRSIGHSTLFSVNEGVTSERVPITTIDQFCTANSIPSIDFLKIDTEGHDLEVIKGAAGMIGSGKIGLVQAEVSMSARNDFQIQFQIIHAEIEKYGYALFGLYDQIPDWKTREPFIRNANAVYIAQKVAAQNKRR